MAIPMRTLIVEDSEEAAELMVRLLEKHGYACDYQRVETGPALESALDEGVWDIVLADYRMPAFNGLDALKLVKQRCRDLPFVLVSGTVGEEVVVQIMRAGADDYVSKDNLPRLVPIVERALEEAKGRRAHREAEEQRRLLTKAIEQAAETIVIADVDARIQYVNPAFERVTGYGRDEALGQHCRLFKSGRHDEAFYTELWDTLAKGETWRGRFVNRKKDGSLYREEAVISPVLDESGRAAHYVAVKRDVTEETALANQLRQSQKMEALGRLAGGMAHDFTNGLVIMMNAAELAKMRVADDPETCELLDTIVEQARKSGDLAADLLAFAQRREVRERNVNLDRLVADLKGMLRGTISTRIALAVETCGASLDVRVDPERIEEAIMHLVVNAQDAMPKGGCLSVSTAMVRLPDAVLAGFVGAGAEQTAGGDYAYVSVSDTGSGMSEETCSHMFEPFYTTKGEGQSSGLGLATVFGIVQQHGGRITVHSSEGIGSTFAMYFPLARGRKARPKAGRPAPSVETGETILLVEDEPVLRALLRRRLEAGGYRVLEAENGEHALRLAAEQPEGSIGSVLADVLMQGVQGRDLAARLNKVDPTLKVVFLSAYPRVYLVASGMLTESDVVLAKTTLMNGPADVIRKTLADYRT